MGEGDGEGGGSFGGRCAGETEQEKKRAAGEPVVVIAGLGENGLEMMATPIADRAGVVGEFSAPAAGEAVGIFFVVEFPANGGADVVADDAAEGDGVGAAEGAGAKTEVDVFAAVEVALVEAAELLPEGALDEDACAGEGGDGTDGGAEAGKERGQGAVMDGLALLVNNDAGVVDDAGASVELDVADEAGAVGQRTMGTEHGLQPMGQEDQVVIEESEKFAAGECAGAVVGTGVAEIAFIEDDTEGRGERREPGARIVGAAVVDENDFVREGGGEGGLQACHTGAGEREVVEEGDNEADLHARTRGTLRAPRD